MLAYVIMRAVSGLVFEHHTLIMLASDDIYHACNGITAVESGRSTFYYLDAFDVVRVDESEVILSAYVAMKALAIHKDEDIGIAQSVHLHLRAHVTLFEIERSRQLREDILNATSCKGLESLMVDYLSLHWSILQ